MTKTSKITYTAIFAAIATVLMYFEFPIPFMPPFLKVDLSGAVVLIGAFIFGIAPAITMIGIKDIIHLTQTQTGGSGEVADFLMLSRSLLSPCCCTADTRAARWLSSAVQPDRSLWPVSAC